MLNSMSRYSLTPAFLVALCLLSPALRVLAISPGQIDTFQDGTVMNWQEGTPSPNPPANVPTGGPAGGGDAFLQNISSGGFGAGSRMLMFNDAQWTGNYNAAGANRLTADMANFGTTTLHMRVVIRGGPNTTIYCSTVAVDLPTDGVWRPVIFDLTPGGMTNLGGADTLADVLGSVTELRILSAEAKPAFMGDPLIGNLGMDNLRASAVTPPTPTSVVSRKLHAGLPFDINLPLTGNPGIECRSGGASSDYQVIFSFANSVTFGGAALSAGTGSVSSASGNGTATVTVNLTGVTNAQRLTVTLQGVNALGDVGVAMGVLVGDSNGDGVVNGGDAIQTRSRSGQGANTTNFRSDVNTDGFVNGGDTIAVRSRSGTFLP